MKPKKITTTIFTLISTIFFLTTNTYCMDNDDPRKHPRNQTPYEETKRIREKVPLTDFLPPEVIIRMLDSLTTDKRMETLRTHPDLLEILKKYT